MAKKLYLIPKGPELEAFIAHERNLDISYLKNMGISQEDAEDIYQDSCIALISNIKDGTLTNLTASNVRSDIEDADDNFNDDCIDAILDIVDDEVESYDEILDQTEELVQNLPEPCNTLIWGKYWEKLSHNELANMLGYKSANVSKTNLSRCLDKFQAKISSLMN